MEQLNTLPNKRLDTKDVDINNASVTNRNQLSIDNIDPKFYNGFHNVISDDDVSHSYEDQPK